MTHPPQQPGQFGQPEPRGPRTGLAASLVLVGLLVLGGGGLGLWLLMSRDAPGSGGGDDARTVAERFVRDLERTVNTPTGELDIAPLEPITCTEDFELMEREIDELDPPATTEDTVPRLELDMKDFRSTADTASFTLTQTIFGDEKWDHELTMAREGGAWKVCGLMSEDRPGSSQPAEPAGSGEPTGPRISVGATVIDGDGRGPSSHTRDPAPSPVPTR